MVRWCQGGGLVAVDGVEGEELLDALCDLQRRVPAQGHVSCKQRDALQVRLHRTACNAPAPPLDQQPPEHGHRGRSGPLCASARRCPAPRRSCLMSTSSSCVHRELHGAISCACMCAGSRFHNSVLAGNLRKTHLRRHPFPDGLKLCGWRGSHHPGELAVAQVLGCPDQEAAQVVLADGPDRIDVCRRTVIPASPDVW